MPSEAHSDHDSIMSLRKKWIKEASINLHFGPQHFERRSSINASAVKHANEHRKRRHENQRADQGNRRQRKRSLKHKEAQQPGTANREHDPGECSQQAQEKVLDQEDPNDLRPRRPQRFEQYAFADSLIATYRNGADQDDYPG